MSNNKGVVTSAIGSRKLRILVVYANHGGC